MSDHPIDRVLARLQKVQQRGEDSWMACCPAHDDHTPSLSVSLGANQQVLLHCFAGCSPEDVRASLGLTWGELHTESPKASDPPRAEPRAAQEDPGSYSQRPDPESLASLDEVLDIYRQRLGEPSATWTYKEQGSQETLGVVLRWDTADGKTIRPAFRCGDGWRASYPTQRPLYGIERIGQEERVFVVEGEKAAAQLHALGFPAVTSPGGSKAAAKADWESLEAHEIVVLPDADEAGQRYSDEVARLLERPGRIVTVQPLPGLRPGSGDDIVEWVQDVHGSDEQAAAKQLEQLAGEAVWSERRRRAVLSVAEVLDDPAWARPPEILRTGVPWWDHIQPFGGIEQGSLTILAAPPRCFKTSLMLFLAWQMAGRGHCVHYLAGEMTRPALVRRVVAMAGEVAPHVVNDPQSPEESQAVRNAQQEIRGLGDRLSLGRAPITLEGITRAAGVADVVFIDYLQLVQPDDNYAGSGRVDELDATMRSVLSVTQQGATVIAAAALNRVGRDTPSLASLRGSSAIEYGATTVYATTEALVGIDPEAETAPAERISAEYACLKQREGEARPLRFDLALKLGPLPMEPSP